MTWLKRVFWMDSVLQPLFALLAVVCSSPSILLTVLQVASISRKEYIPMFDTVKSKITGALVAGSILASNAMAAAPQWATNAGNDTTMNDILGEIAPLALAVVFGVAGVRVAIKLINRGAGK